MDLNRSLYYACVAVEIRLPPHSQHVLSRATAIRTYAGPHHNRHTNSAFATTNIQRNFGFNAVKTALETLLVAHHMLRVALVSVDTDPQLATARPC